MSTPILKLQSQDRPRERLLQLGADGLSERELLALVLRNGRSGESALDLASALLGEFGGLPGLSRARPEELARLKGVGPAKAGAIVAAFRLGTLASHAAKHLPEPLAGPREIACLVRPLLEGARREKLLVVICDSANRLIQIETISEGSVDRAMVPVREILNSVLRHDGRAFALAHNHPSGNPTPSLADIEATRSVSGGAVQVGLRFLDHVILCGNDWRAIRGHR